VNSRRCPAKYSRSCYAIGIDDIRDWEDAYTPVQRGDIGLLNTHLAPHWDLIPAGFDYLRGWPGLSGAAAPRHRSRR
jgi:hypothetical protein